MFTGYGVCKVVRQIIIDMSKRGSGFIIILAVEQVSLIKTEKFGVIITASTVAVRVFA